MVQYRLQRSAPQVAFSKVIHYRRERRFSSTIRLRTHKAMSMSALAYKNYEKVMQVLLVVRQLSDRCIDVKP
jgi:hypothetical protein